MTLLSKGAEDFSAGKMGARDEVEERAEAPGGRFADKVEARDGGFEAASENWSVRTRKMSRSFSSRARQTSSYFSAEFDKPPAHEPKKSPEPGFFLLGAKSYGRNSSFLLRVGFEQVRDAFTLIAGKAGLDLYKKR